MRRRIYFLLPETQSCKRIVAELKQNGIGEHHIHALAREDIPLGDLHEASALQKTELGHGVEMGIGVGGMAGMLGGLLAVTFPPAGLVLGGGALLVVATTLIGAGFGSIVSMLIAGDIPNQELAGFRDAISRGEILLIVEIPVWQVDDMKALIRLHHPELKIGVVKSA